MLTLEYKRYHQVKKGETLDRIAKAYNVAKRVLIQENGLTEEVYAGQILLIPKTQGNSYTVQEGDTKTLLCGSDENFQKKNGTDALYLGMKVIL